MADPASPLHLLVYGELDSGVTDTLRIGAFLEPLGARGIEVRTWSSFGDDILRGGPELSALSWADVVLFRRWRSTHSVCTECETAFATPAELTSHVVSTGHSSLVPDTLIRPIVALLTTHPELLSGRGVVYDADDDVLDYPAWTGLGFAAARERDLILSLLSLADLVTVATPVLADRLRPHVTAPIRVIRNALDPAWYRAPSGVRMPGPAGTDSGEIRVVYHGVPVRLRDYEVARAAVDAVAHSVHGIKRIWLGAAHEPRVAAAVDEVEPWIKGVVPFAAALASARPDIGLAPLLDEPFNRAKSELHWLEYSLAGAPTIVSGFNGPGPFDVVRDGVDGLVARDAADWERQLRRLAGSSSLRAELADRAGERVAGEYSIESRVGEWASAYRFAAERAGSGRR